MLRGRTIALDKNLLKRLRKTFNVKDLKEIEAQLFELMADPTKAEAKLEYKKHGGFYVFDLQKGRRAILVEAGSSLVVVYVGNHDEAYQWIKNRRVEVHPETREIVVFKTIEKPKILERIVERFVEAPLRRYSPEYLHSLGVPRDYIEPLRKATENGVLKLLEGLPESLYGPIFSLMDGKPVPPPPKIKVADLLKHPSNRYRYLLIETKEDLEQALFGEWEDWMVFLHPAQRAVVDQDYRGPAKVTGAAGTGKTVVAIHRAVRLARENPEARVLLTTYTRTLAEALQDGVVRLSGELKNLEVEHFDRLLTRWYTEALGKKLAIAKDDQIKAALAKAAAEVGLPDWASELFLFNEWERVVDAWGVRSLEEYLAVDRTGRGTPLSQARRRELWPVFDRARNLLVSQGLETWGGRTRALLDNLEKLPRFDHVVVDETQDLSPIQLKLLRAIVPEGKNDLFLVGDAAQRIYQAQVPWRRLGIETVGRSQRLWINYRTTREIADFAGRVLPDKVTEAEGEEVVPKALSLLSGESPSVQMYAQPNQEITALANWLKFLVEQGYEPEEIAIVARTKKLLRTRGAAAVERAGLPLLYLEEGGDGSGVRLATMHRVKGLEFRAVAVVGVEDGALPNAYVLKQAETEADREALLELERQLLFVALSRAREKLWVSGAGRASPLLPG